MKIRYRANESDDTQIMRVRWGSNDDPRGLLEPGGVYTLDHEEVHSYHTKFYLVEFPGKKFNSAHFDPA